MSATDPTIWPVLAGKVALITGAAQGIGKATAAVFLQARAKVVICDIQEEEGKQAEKELAELGEVLFIKADVSKSKDVQELVAQTVAKFGRLDAAVNNAALVPDVTPLSELDEEHWEKVLGTNLTGPALCCKYEMKEMIKLGIQGTIVNIASVGAFKPQPNMPAYTASKTGLLGLTRHGAMEGGPHGIRVNCIAPGAVYVSQSEIDSPPKFTD
jgi:NAD(P)-dependent dehydrogenase (short-subunit alcohol dehydrogenase family)